MNYTVWLSDVQETHLTFSAFLSNDQLAIIRLNHAPPSFLFLPCSVLRRFSTPSRKADSSFQIILTATKLPRTWKTLAMDGPPTVRGGHRVEKVPI